MTDKELIDGYLAGELDEAGMAQLESELAANPALLHELAEQQQVEMALRVLLEDETADQQVAVSVLGVIRGKPLDQFKTDLLKKVKQVDAEKRREEEAVRVQTTPIPFVPDVPLARPKPVARRSGWRWAAAAALLAAAAGWMLLRPAAADPVENRTAFVLVTGPGARVQRGAESLPASLYMVLQPGDRLTAAEGDRVQIGFHADTSRVDLAGAGVLVFLQGGRAKRLELARGEAEASVSAQAEPLVLSTPHGDLRLEEAQARLSSAAGFARAEVVKGAATLVRRPDGRSVRLAADQYAVAGPGVELLAKAVEKSAPAVPPAAVATVRTVQGEAFLFEKSPADRIALRPGQGLPADRGIVTGARGRVVLEYPDQTRLEIGEETVVRRLVSEDGAAKLVRLEGGAVAADVVKQPAGRPMKLVTPHAEAGVLGTRFLLTHGKDSTRLQVEEGAVEFTRLQDKKKVVVRSGFAASVAPGLPFEPAPAPGGVRYLDIDLAAGLSDGGLWKSDGRTVRQETGEPLASHLFRVEPVEEGALLEATVEVDRVAGSPDAWGFGLAAVFGERRIVLRSHQGDAAGSFLEFQGLRGVPFEHGQEGRYRLKLRVERKGAVAVLLGKIWQGEREPDDWVIQDEAEVSGTMTQVGFQAQRCACSFSSFRVKVLKESR